MEQDVATSDITQPTGITHPASIFRCYRYPRRYTNLPEGKTWAQQKQRYCPECLLFDGYDDAPDLHRSLLEQNHKYGYVFCHRGLYDHALRIVENSVSAIKNGIRENMFLHEFDAWVPHTMAQVIVAHDQHPRRVTPLKERWEAYSPNAIFRQAIVTRGLTENQDPDFASSYLETDEKVPSVLKTLWKEVVFPVGCTLQIDFRESDLSKALAFYSYHIVHQPRSCLTPQKSVIQRLFQSTILKGYNVSYTSFDDLCEATREESVRVYGRNYFEPKCLQNKLPVLMMVFYASALEDLAKRTEPKNPEWDRRGYEHLRHTFKKQVSSFVGAADGCCNFIPDIVHSGLGLGYDRTTHTARNPLDWTELTTASVIHESLVDRVMIDFLHAATRRDHAAARKGHAECEIQDRLEDLKTGPLPGPSAELRAIPGGLYPQSHLVVADDPVAEIAARTWIEETAGLDRSELLTTSYWDWLGRAGKDVVDAMRSLTGEYLPNMYGCPIEPLPEVPDQASGRHDDRFRSESRINSWRHNVPEYVPEGEVSPTTPKKFIELEDISHPVTDAIAPAPLPLFDESELMRATITIGGVQFVFDQPANGQCLAFKRVKSRAHESSRWSPYPTRQEPGLLYVPADELDDESQRDIRPGSAQGNLPRMELITEVKQLSTRGATGPRRQGRRVLLPPPWAWRECIQPNTQGCGCLVCFVDYALYFFSRERKFRVTHRSRIDSSHGSQAV